MSANIARDGRRRRVLNDEVLHGAMTAPTAEVSADAPRYGDGASIENHPQVSDFVPRKRRTMLLVLGGLAAVAAVAQGLRIFADPIAAAVPGASVEAIRDQWAGGLLQWCSAMSLAGVALAAKLVYSLRRHRVADVRGQYRAWRWASRGAMLASFDAVAGLHVTTAAVASAAAGSSLTATGAEWWGAPLGVIIAWQGMRILRELRECPAAMVLIFAAAGCYGVAFAGACGASVAAWGVWNDALTASLPLLGHALALTATLAYARYVVLDVQGLIDHAPRQPRVRREAPVEIVATLPLPVAAAPAAAPAVAAADDSWDGEEGDETSVPLSKADKKRLRKQQRTNRAA